MWQHKKLPSGLRSKSNRGNSGDLWRWWVMVGVRDGWVDELAVSKQKNSA